jgi:hypothetical protein
MSSAGRVALGDGGVRADRVSAWCNAFGFCPIATYYAFMRISRAMRGLASGGLLVQLTPGLLTGERFSVQAMICGAAMGMFGIVGTLAVLTIYPHTNVGSLAFTPGHIWPLAGLFWCLFPFFLCGVLVVAMVFARYRAHFNLLYAVDLVFAAGGCLLAISMLEGATPVQVILGFCAVPMLAGALFGLADHRKAAGSIVAVAAMCGRLPAGLSQMESVAASPNVAHEADRPAGNAVSAVRVHPGRFFTWALSSRYSGPRYDMLDLIIDGTGGTEIVRFDGNPATLKDYAYLDQDLTALSNRLLPAEANQLIIGPGGGDRRPWRGSNIAAVEINPPHRAGGERPGIVFRPPFQLRGIPVLENGRLSSNGPTGST